MKSVFTMPDGSKIMIETEGNKILTSFLNDSWEKAAEVDNGFTLGGKKEHKYHKAIRKSNIANGFTFHPEHSTKIK